MAVASQTRRSLWRFAGALLCVLVAGAILLAALRPNAVQIVTASPTYSDLDTSVITTGKVVPVHAFQAHAIFPGVIDRIYVHLGEQVHPGQLLLSMRDPYATSRVTSALSALKSTEVSYTNVMGNGSQEDRINASGDRAHLQTELDAAQDSLQRLQGLRQSGAASDAEVRAATERLENARASMDTLTERNAHRYSAQDTGSWAARVADAKAALDAARASLANANITTPIAGIVSLMPVRASDFVPTGADLLTVSDLGSLTVHALFDEPDIGKLHTNQSVLIHWEGKPDRTWHGHVQQVPIATSISGSRSVGECVIQVDDVHDDLPPNSTVTVEVGLQKRAHVLTVPREALHTSEDANVVYRVVDGKLVQTRVDIGLLSLTKVEVVRGISAQDTVALHAADNSELLDRLKVKAAP